MTGGTSNSSPNPKPPLKVAQAFAALPEAYRKRWDSASGTAGQQELVDTWLAGQVTQLLTAVHECRTARREASTAGAASASDALLDDQSTAAINQCVYEKRGFGVFKADSAIGDNAGDGAFLRGGAARGSVLTFYAGPLHDDVMLNPAVSLGNGHLMSRYDGSSIDGRACSHSTSSLGPQISRLAATGSLCYEAACGASHFATHALGQIFNHPPCGARPNAMYVPCELPPSLPPHLRALLPNLPVRPLLGEGSAAGGQGGGAGEGRTVVLVALDGIADSAELLVNYGYECIPKGDYVPPDDFGAPFACPPWYCPVGRDGRAQSTSDCSAKQEALDLAVRQRGEAGSGGK